MTRDWKNDAVHVPHEPLPRKARTRKRAGPPAVALPEEAQRRPLRSRPWEPPTPKRRAKAADLIAHDADITLEMAEQLIDEGIDIRTAGTMVQLAALWSNRPALGRPTDQPRLTDRAPRSRKDGTPGLRKARIVFCGKYSTTGIVLQDDEVAEEHLGAKIFLRRWKKKLAHETLGKLQAPNKTMREIFREILTGSDPGASQDPALTSPYKRWLCGCTHETFTRRLTDFRRGIVPTGPRPRNPPRRRRPPLDDNERRRLDEIASAPWPAGRAAVKRFRRRMLSHHFPFVRRLLAEDKIPFKTARALFRLTRRTITLYIFDLDNGLFHLATAPHPGPKERQMAQALAIREYAASPGSGPVALWKRLRLDFHYPLEFDAFRSILFSYVAGRYRQPAGIPVAPPAPAQLL